MNSSAHKRLGIAYIKMIIIWTLVLSVGLGGFLAYKNNLIPNFFSQNNSQENQQDNDSKNESPETAGIEEEGDFTGIVDDKNALSNKAKEKSALVNQKEAKNPEDKSQNFNILILGIDRRHANQTSWRTDVIQLLTVSADRKHAVVTHIPRDVWADNYKINAVYNLQGPDAIKDEINKITGQRPDRIIRVDFDAFVAAVDAADGVTIDNPVEFTDNSYPDDRNGSDQIISVTFPKGQQVLDGEQALIFARSRKGNNGQGSDYARGSRQQMIMQAIVSDFFKPGNLFTPKTAETLYNIATRNVYTDINLKDTQVLFEVLKDYKNIDVKTLGLSTANFLTVPSDTSNYGGAWTLVPKTDYQEIHRAIEKLLKGEELQLTPSPTPSTSPVETGD